MILISLHFEVEDVVVFITFVCLYGLLEINVTKAPP